MASARNNGWRGKRTMTLTLACGCVRRVWDRPRPDCKFACPGNLGHGYRVAWISVVGENGITNINPKEETR